MKSRLLSLLILTFGAAGCVDDRASVEIYALCGMPENCTFSGSCDVGYIGAVYFAPGTAMLQLAFEMHNQLPNNMDLQTGRVNSNDAHITGGTVTYSGTATAGIMPGDWSFFTVGTVPADGTSVIWAYVASAGIPAGEYRAELTLSGYFDNGNDFETGPFPIGLLVGAFAFGCTGTEVDVCPGTGAQSVYACAEP